MSDGQFHPQDSASPNESARKGAGQFASNGAAKGAQDRLIRPDCSFRDARCWCSPLCVTAKSWKAQYHVASQAKRSKSSGAQIAWLRACWACLTSRRKIFWMRTSEDPMNALFQHLRALPSLHFTSLSADVGRQVTGNREFRKSASRATSGAGCLSETAVKLTLRA